MLAIRTADARGHADFGWLNSRHTFSFGSYYDPQHMGIGPLRVINEDRVQPGRGFDTHGHRDMEIISYVIEGALEHKDSMGNGSIIRPGDVQLMSAGTGVRHSEHNHSSSEPVHFLQIWIMPEQDGLAPGYQQKRFTEEEKQGRLRLVGSRDGREGSVLIHQDVDLYASVVKAADVLTYRLNPGRIAWLQVLRGAVQLNGRQLEAGDGAAVTEALTLDIASLADSEILLFDMCA